MSDERLDLAVQLRHALHAHPELSGREFWTRQTLMDFLRAHTRLEVVDRGSWFYARRRGRGEGKVAFRADFDALPMEETLQIPHRSCCPGAAHKCGHDGHSAALALLGLILDEEGAARDTYLIFQPAEEIGGGGEACAAFLREEGIGEVYAFHNMPGYPLGAVALRSGTMNCASKGMILRFTGVPTHASTPELGRNPAYAVAAVVSTIPELTGRRSTGAWCCAPWWASTWGSGPSASPRTRGSCCSPSGPSTRRNWTPSRRPCWCWPGSRRRSTA